MLLKCDICNTKLTKNNIGFVKNPHKGEGEPVRKCKTCHKPNRQKPNFGKNAMYRSIDDL